MKIRSTEERDFDAVVALLEELGRARVSDETRPRCREIFDGHVRGQNAAAHLVAEDPRGAVVGFCSLHFRERLNFPTEDAWVPDLIVTAPARRRGVARMLLQEAERRARGRRCWQLTLESGYERADAHRLYLAFGMEDAGKHFRKGLG